MNEGQGEQKGAWATQHVDVGSQGQMGGIAFKGQQINYLQEESDAGQGQGTRGVTYTLYKTPEGYKLHVLEWLRKGNMNRPFGQTPAEHCLIRGELCSEGQARQTYPEKFQKLLDTA